MFLGRTQSWADQNLALTRILVLHVSFREAPSVELVSAEETRKISCAKRVHNLNFMAVQGIAQRQGISARFAQRRPPPGSCFARSDLPQLRRKR
ncbi:hypothetical protein Pla52n_64460 [Stieleria varia]|uniref:Uncharacterized protein n=1 Tax=Stieleria varia TaxID=2528005 RepID=A0A5C6A0B3_9BACT|nr:hypothetical protein Pla52n_64460 [Stieleria varia]